MRVYVFQLVWTRTDVNVSTTDSSVLVVKWTPTPVHLNHVYTEVSPCGHSQISARYIVHAYMESKQQLVVVIVVLIMR